MEKNESSLDRWTRAALGIALLALVFIGPKTAWGWLGVLPLATAIVGYCPLYRVLHIDTCHRMHA